MSIQFPIEFGVIGFLIGVAIFFLGLLLAAKVTSFDASPSSLAITSGVVCTIALIPSIVGGVLALVAQYLMLKKFNPSGQVVLTMVVSVVTTIFAAAAMVSLLEKIV